MELTEIMRTICAVAILIAICISLNRIKKALKRYCAKLSARHNQEASHV